MHFFLFFVKITHLVIRKKDNTSAFRVINVPIIQCGHIIANIPKYSNPVRQ